MYCVLNWFDFLECSLAQANKQTVQTLDSINYWGQQRAAARKQRERKSCTNWFESRVDSPQHTLSWFSARPAIFSSAAAACNYVCIANVPGCSRSVCTIHTHADGYGTTHSQLTIFCLTRHLPQPSARARLITTIKVEGCKLRADWLRAEEPCALAGCVHVRPPRPEGSCPRLHSHYHTHNAPCCHY